MLGLAGLGNCVSLEFGCVFQGVRLRGCGKLGALCQVFEPDARDVRIPGLARSVRRRSGAEWLFVDCFVWFWEWGFDCCVFALLVVGFDCADL